MISLPLAALAFIGIHLGVSGSSLRTALVSRLGLGAYMIGFSVASVAAMVWLVSAYNAADYHLTWGRLEWWKPFAIALMLPAFVLVVVGLATPKNPTAVGQEAQINQPATGMLRITRHPFLVGSALWAAVHLVGNGDLASTLFFASLLIVAAAGTVSIDAKRRQALGAPAWDAFARQTSIIPFGAIVSGRNHLSLAEIGWWRLALGILAYVLFLGGHKHIVGVSPFPW